jgi:photosystem II stability/assembly factor-like uncharacterized protein
MKRRVTVLHFVPTLLSACGIFALACAGTGAEVASQPFAIEVAIKDMRAPCQMPGDAAKGSPTQFFSDMRFLDGRTGWIRAGNVYWCWTTDGGETWAPMRSEDGRTQFGPGDFLTRQHGLVRWADREDSFGETTDGGRHWTDLKVPSSTCCGAMQFTDDRNGWVVGFKTHSDRSPRPNGDTIYRTTDGARSWLERSPTVTGSICSFDFVSEAGWIAGCGSQVFRTGDGGAHWTEVRNDKRDSFSRIRFVDARTGFVVGNRESPDGLSSQGLILSTRDGGQTWTQPSARLATKEHRLIDVLPISTTEAWAFGWPQAVLRTVDGGSHWKMLSLSRSPAAALSWSALVEPGGRRSILVLDSQGTLFRIRLSAAAERAGGERR